MINENTTFDDIYKAMNDGSLDNADLPTLKDYLKATYNPRVAQQAHIPALQSVRHTLQHLIQCKQHQAGHGELRGDNSRIICLTIAILVVAIITLAALVVFWRFPRP